MYTHRGNFGVQYIFWIFPRGIVALWLAILLMAEALFVEYIYIYIEVILVLDFFRVARTFSNYRTRLTLIGNWAHAPRSSFTVLRIFPFICFFVLTIFLSCVPSYIYIYIFYFMLFHAIWNSLWTLGRKKSDSRKVFHIGRWIAEKVNGRHRGGRNREREREREGERNCLYTPCLIISYALVLCPLSIIVSMFKFHNTPPDTSTHQYTSPNLTKLHHTLPHTTTHTPHHTAPYHTPPHPTTPHHTAPYHTSPHPTTSHHTSYAL